MKKEHTQQVTTDFFLITGNQSREMLRRAIELQGPRKQAQDPLIDNEKIERLRAIYAHYRPKCGSASPVPRNLPFYLALKDRYPGIHWDIKPDAAKASVHRYQVVLCQPRVRGMLVSLAALLLQELPATEIHMSKHIPSELQTLPPAVRDDFMELLEVSHAVMPGSEVLRDMTGLLLKGLAGEALVAVCPVCPDYAAEATGQEDAPYRYTFKGLGEGIGLVAGRLLQDLPRYAAFFRRHNIDVRFLVAQGDFEGFSPETLERVGVKKEEFMRRLRLSGKALDAQLQGLPARTMFFTDFCGGEAGWRQLHAQMEARLRVLASNPAKEDCGFDWEHVLIARRPLYERWFGPMPSLKAYLPFLVHQAAEYAAMGAIAHRVSPNSFLLCCDHSVMAPFYKSAHGTPVIYLKRNYA